MTDVINSGVGKSAFDFKTNKPIADAAEWTEVLKNCQKNVSARSEGNSAQSAALIKDVFTFMGNK